MGRFTIRFWANRLFPIYLEQRNRLRIVSSMNPTEYRTFKFMLEGKTAKWISVVATSLEAARADIAEAYFNPVIITVRICSK